MNKVVFANLCQINRWHVIFNGYVMDSDHFFVLQDADGQSARGAVNMIGGKVINLASSNYANDNWFSDTFFST